MNAFFHNEKLLATFSNRFGGVSKKPYDSLNIATHVGDEIKDVIKNRNLLALNLNFSLKKLIYMEQIHSDRVVVVRDTLINKIKNCDAIITNIKNTPLMVMVADCLPILLFDRKNRVIGAVHAGRNSTFKEIVKKTIQKMQKEFDSKVKDILVSFGASIHSCCYEVDNSLANIASKNFGEKYIDNRDNKFYLNLQLLNFDQLLEIGVKKGNIEISSECSCCDKSYFSYRREKTTGRFAGIIMLR